MKQVRRATLRHLASLVSLTLLLGSSQTLAQETTTYLDPSEAVGLIKHVSLIVEDSVNDGCWTNVSGVRSKLRLALERDGVAVLDYEPYTNSLPAPFLRFRGTGYRSNSLCFGVFDFEVGYWTSERFGGANGIKEFGVGGWFQIFKSGSLFSGPNNLNQEASEFVESATAQFLADVYAARRSQNVQLFFEELPWLAEPPLTEEQVLELLGAASE